MDFVNRTHCNIRQIDREKFLAKDKSVQEAWTDSLSRCVLADEIMNDKSPMSALMFQSETVEWGANVLEKSKLCTEP